MNPVRKSRFKEKKTKFIQMTHAHVEAVKNINSAVEEKESKADTDKREQAKAKSRKVNKWDRL